MRIRLHTDVEGLALHTPSYGRPECFGLPAGYSVRAWGMELCRMLPDGPGRYRSDMPVRLAAGSEIELVPLSTGGP